jgi:single-strand DNA-binding protein
MSSVGLNKWIVSGNLAADAEIKMVDLKSGEKAKVAEATIYVRKPRSRDESFTVKLSIWESSAAWRKLPFLKKGSLIICTGNLEPNPYVSKTDNQPKAGLDMNVLDIDLDNVRNAEDEPDQSHSPVATAKPSTASPSASAKGTSTPVATKKAAPAQPVLVEATKS